MPSEPPAWRAQVEQRLQEAVAGKPSEQVTKAITRALQSLAGAGDAVAQTALSSSSGPAPDGLLRRWAEALSQPAQLLKEALPNPASEVEDGEAGADVSVGRYLQHTTNWLERQGCPVATEEASRLRALVNREQQVDAMLDIVVVLARLTWPDVGSWWKAQQQSEEKPLQPAPAPARRHSAVSLRAAQAVLDLRSPTPTRAWLDDGRQVVGIEEAEEVRLELVGVPRKLADKLLRGDLGVLRSRAAAGVLDVLLRALDAELDRQPFDGRRPPRLVVPAGRRLANAALLAGDGASARAADEALWAWTALRVGDWRGTLRRFLLGPERLASAPWRAASWIVTPGELLLPSQLVSEASQEARSGRLPARHRAWRRLVPWPDVRAPDDWARGSAWQLQAAPWAALGLLVEWTEAAGKDHGRRWLTEPGVPIGRDEQWADLVQRVHAPVLEGRRTAALEGWEEAEWVTVEGDLVAPGPALPRLKARLDDAARLAKKNHRRRRRGKS